MEALPSRPVTDLFSGRLLWLQLGNTAVLVASSVGAVIMFGTGWSWLLFTWGIAIGLLWLAATNRLLFFALGRIGYGAHEIESARATHRSHDRRLYRPEAFGIGVTAGVFAAGFESPWPDVALLVYAVAAWTVSLLTMLPSLRRGQAKTPIHPGLEMAVRFFTGQIVVGLVFIALGIVLGVHLSGPAAGGAVGAGVAGGLVLVAVGVTYRRRVRAELAELREGLGSSSLST